MRISDWSSDVCSSDLRRRQNQQRPHGNERQAVKFARLFKISHQISADAHLWLAPPPGATAISGNCDQPSQSASAIRPEKITAVHLVRDIGEFVRHPVRSEEHTSELQSLMRTSYAVFC